MIAETRYGFRLGGPELLAGTLVIAAAIVALRVPSAFEPAWRCAVFLGLGPTIGALSIACLHSMTGGKWGDPLRPALMAGCWLLPFMVALGLPLVVLRATEATTAATRFNAPGIVAVRAVILGLALVALARTARREWPAAGHRATMRWFGPLGLIAVFFINHVLLDDWLAPSDGAPSGTAFPLIWLLGQAVSALALAVIAALRLGFDPRRPLASERTLGNDVGTLLFAAVMTWCYVAFAHFLIIWSGNLPREVAWYVVRIRSAWGAVPLVLLVLNLAAPMLVLLSRRAKDSRRALAVIAIVLAAGQVLHTTWIILPPEPGVTMLVAIGLTCGGGILGLRAGMRLAREEGGAP
ncbi:MAG TPA: hypothetical protein VGM73_14045 [Candidatus Didemnitutus sp.]|jgi:hypothetical protein